jgi:hypothetical protein
MESSWPRGRYLVELMEGSTKARTEKDTVKALRFARVKLDQELDALAKKRDSVLSSLKRLCNHPLEQTQVTETSDGADDVYTVACGACSAELRVHKKET